VAKVKSIPRGLKPSSLFDTYGTAKAVPLQDRIHATGCQQMLRAVEGGVTLAVRAQPGAKKTAIAGLWGEGAEAQLKIAVQAPPIEGRANQALAEFLAALFSVAKNRVELRSGDLGRSKVFLVRGVSLAEAEQRIGGSGESKSASRQFSKSAG